MSFRAQYVFVDHAKHSQIPSTLEALGLDTGAVIFALLALSLARRGRRASVERVLNVACALGSLAMNLLAADLTSPRSVTVWVMPSALYALASDRLIAVVRRWASVPGTGRGPRRRRFGVAGVRRSGSLGPAPGLRPARDDARLPGWVLSAAPVAPGVRRGSTLIHNASTGRARTCHGG